jgi:hypothetical protein
MTRQTVLLNTHPLNPKASRTSVRGNTVQLMTKVSLQVPGLPKGVMSKVTPPRPYLPLTLTTLGNWTTLGKCGTLRDSRSWPVVTQPGNEPGSVVTPLTL